jgi:hypothetical protein
VRTSDFKCARYAGQCEYVIEVKHHNSFLLCDAGLNPSDLRKSNTTVVVSASISESENTWMYSTFQSGLEFLGHSRAMLANRVSFWLDINGEKQQNISISKRTKQTAQYSAVLN